MVTHADENEGESKKLSCTVIANIFMLSTVCPYRVVIHIADVYANSYFYV